MFYNIIFNVCMCVRDKQDRGMCHRMYVMKVKGQLWGVGSLLPLWALGMELSCQAYKASPFTH